MGPQGRPAGGGDWNKTIGGGKDVWMGISV